MENKQTTALDIKRLNTVVNQGLQNTTLAGFEKAYSLAKATEELKQLLTPVYMKPIMSIQGSKLGFKTDKDSSGGYPEAVVKNCLIEAVLTGVEPVGNMWNIIANNCYITKEGFGYLLKNVEGLKYTLTFKLPRINESKTSAAIVAEIEWSYMGQKDSKEIEFPVKMNAYMGADAVVGKATRKARAWLYNHITGNEIADGDVDSTGKTVDAEAEVMESESRKQTLSDAQKAIQSTKNAAPPARETEPEKKPSTDKKDPIDEPNHADFEAEQMKQKANLQNGKPANWENKPGAPTLGL